MKNLIFFFLFVSSVFVSAQSNSKNKYRFGFKLGGSSCNVTGSRVKTHGKGGLNFGFWLQLRISKHWTIQAELLSIKKGAGGFIADRPRVTGDYLLGLSYIE